MVLQWHFATALLEKMKMSRNLGSMRSIHAGLSQAVQLSLLYLYTFSVSCSLNLIRTLLNKSATNECVVSLPYILSAFHGYTESPPLTCGIHEGMAAKDSFFVFDSHHLRR